MSGWSVRAFCPCGWSNEPSFGNVWFTEKSHPCCPACGGSCYAYSLHTVRYVGREVGKWKLFGLFERPKIEWNYEDAAGNLLSAPKTIQGQLAASS